MSFSKSKKLKLLPVWSHHSQTHISGSHSIISLSRCFFSLSEAAWNWFASFKDTGALSVPFIAVLKLRAEHLPNISFIFLKSLVSSVWAVLSSPEKHVTVASLVRNALFVKRKCIVPLKILKILKTPKPIWRYFCNNLFEWYHCVR